MPATGAAGRFTGITRGDVFIDMRRRVASGAVAAMHPEGHKGRFYRRFIATTIGPIRYRARSRASRFRLRRSSRGRVQLLPKAAGSQEP
jgi:hypothetical protein